VVKLENKRAGTPRANHGMTNGDEASYGVNHSLTGKACSILLGEKKKTL
jgi:hypothetical protein